MRCPVFLYEVGVSSQQIRVTFWTGRIREEGCAHIYMWERLRKVLITERKGQDCSHCGVGYPALNDRRAQSNQHMMLNSGTDGNIHWDPTIRKVRQLLACRAFTARLWGRILLDGRYTSTSVKRYGKYSVFKSSRRRRAEIIDVEPERVKYSLMNFLMIWEKNASKPIKIITKKSKNLSCFFCYCKFAHYLIDSFFTYRRLLLRTRWQNPLLLQCRRLLLLYIYRYIITSPTFTGATFPIFTQFHILTFDYRLLGQT